MNPDKKYILDEIKERVDVSPFVLVVDYTGVTVPEFDELRGRLSDAGAECHVAKNTFMKRVLADAGILLTRPVHIRRGHAIPVTPETSRRTTTIEGRPCSRKRKQ